MQGELCSLRIWGPLACFTRPELKVERVSYPIITPSAARGILESIFRTAHCRWQVERIELLSPPRYLGLRRNEVKERVPATATVMRWISGRVRPSPLQADAKSMERGRTQRQTLALRDVAYRLHARLTGSSKAFVRAATARFHRRAACGACFQQPYLGCREFPCYFEPASSNEAPPYPLDLDLGLMLYDVFPLDQPGSSPAVSLFHATVKAGVLEVPEYSSPLVLKGHPVV
jgi:CRISPR-associated protein Cas5d